MALDDPYDPYAPTPPVVPWSWVPEGWNQAAEPSVPQPGIGIPQATLEAAAPAPTDIEMPAMDMAPQPEIEMPPMDVGQPTIGFPREPIDAEPLFPPAQGAPTLGALTSFVTDPVTGAADAIQNENRGPASMPFLNEAEPPSPFGVQLTDEQRARQFAASTPEERSKQEYDWLQGRQAKFDELDRAARLQDEQKALENESAAQKARIASRQAMVQVDEESRKAAAEQVDGDRWWNSRGTGQKIAGFLSAIVGGLVQARTGGANQGLAMIEAEIDRDVDIQKFNLQAKRAELQRRGASIQQLAAFDQESFVDAERRRLGSMARVQGQIKSEMQNYDPAGKTAIELGKTYAGLEASRQQGLIAFQDQHFKHQLEVLKADSALAKEAAETAEIRAKTAKITGALGGGGAKKPDEVEYTPQQLAALHPTIDPALIPVLPMSLKSFSQHLDRAGKGGAAGKTVREGSEDERARENGVAGLFEKDGKTPWLARDKDVAKDLTKKRYVAQRIVDITNKILAIRDEVGGESSWGNSDARQRLDVLQNQLTILAKKGTEGMSSDEDMKKLNGALGAADVASFRERAAGLVEGLNSTVDNLNEELIANGYEGPPISFPNMYKGKGKSTPEQENFKKLKNSDTGAVNDPLPAAAWGVVPGAKWIAKGVNALRSEDTNLPAGEEKTQIDAWAKDIGSGDKAASDRAQGYLIGLGNSGSPAVREYAHQQYYEAMGKLGRTE